MTGKMPGPLAFQAMMVEKVLAHRAEIEEDIADPDRNGHELALGIDGLLTELCSDIADVIGLGPEQKKAFMSEAGCYDRA